MKIFSTIIGLSITGMILIGQTSEKKSKGFVMDKVVKSDNEWQTCLTPEQYQILREKGTEMAFTGKYYKHKDKGTYVCAGCENELFSSDTKYDSGSGWPAFFDAIDETKVNTKKDLILLEKKKMIENRPIHPCVIKTFVVICLIITSKYLFAIETLCD